jgi:hypothetical protein
MLPYLDLSPAFFGCDDSSLKYAALKIGSCLI